MRNLLITILLLTIWSCDITKQASKTKTETDLNEQYERIEKRDGGVATFKPEPTIIYRDTTVYVQGTNGTQLRVIYDKQGKESQMDCYGALIDIREKYNKQLQESVKEKDKQKTEEVNTDWIMYGFIALTLIMFFGMFLLYMLINKRLPKTIG